jgi:hypothetical protein
MTYSIIKADLIKDGAATLAILERNLQDISPQRYRWSYEDSPNGKAHCWLAKREDQNQFVGTGALFPRKIFLNGKAVWAGVAGDLAVDQKHRIFGPALTLQKRIQASLRDCGFEFIYGVPNKPATPLFLKLGYKELGQYRQFIKALKVEYKTDVYLPPVFLTKRFPGAVNFLLKKLSREYWEKRTPEIHIETPSFFDKKFDVFWERVLKEFRIIGERNSQFLNWRYTQSPRRRHDIFRLMDDHAEMIGYIVYYVQEGRAHIVDMLSFNSPETLNRLLSEFIFYMRRQEMGSISIRCLGAPGLCEALHQFNFIEYKKEAGPVVLYTDHASFFPELYQKDNWYFLEGDNDI